MKKIAYLFYLRFKLQKINVINNFKTLSCQKEGRTILMPPSKSPCIRPHMGTTDLPFLPCSCQEGAQEGGDDSYLQAAALEVEEEDEEVGWRAMEYIAVPRGVSTFFWTNLSGSE